jgi:peroxiredoxin
MTRINKLLGLTAAVAFSAAALSFVSPAQAGEGCSSCSGTVNVNAENKMATVGQTAPDFKLMDQNGEAVSLSDHKGKIVVLEVFNDQCPFVKKFYKNGDMNRMAADMKDKGVVWLAIDSSNFSSVEENKAIASEWNIDRPLLDDSAGKVGKMYQAKTTPHMYVIAKDGTLAYAGAIDSIQSTDASDIAQADNYVVMAVDALMNGETPSPSETKPYGCSVKY